MKKLLILFACVLIAGTSCGKNSSLGIIGGEDGPTQIIVGSTSETVQYDEVSQIDGIPTPPGKLKTAWKSTESGMIYIEMNDVEKYDCYSYADTTLSEAGFDGHWNETDDDEKSNSESYYAENEKYIISMIYSDNVLRITATEK